MVKREYSQELMAPLEGQAFTDKVEGEFRDRVKVSVYLNNGLVYEYYVDDSNKGREHASEIITTGYRSSDGNDLVWWPPHRINKVKVEGGAESTQYRDTVRPT